VCGEISTKGAVETGLRVARQLLPVQAIKQLEPPAWHRLSRGGQRYYRHFCALFLRHGSPRLDLLAASHVCHAIPGRWHIMGVTQAAGLSLRWFRDTFAINSSGAAIL